jgi:predicted alpha/beta hydrolase
VQELNVAALDGFELPSTLFEPEDVPIAAAIVSPATATPRGYYHSFCRYLAANGIAAITYDYRGTFESPRDLRNSRARMRDWGEQDFPGVVEWMKARYPQLPLYAVGHSVGGHVLLMAPNSSKISRAVTVASQSGFWRLYRGFEKYRVFAFVKAIMPALTRLFGFFPGKRVVFGANLAPGVLYEWSRWCTSPHYFFDDSSMHSLENARGFTAPTLMIGLADDPWATPRAIDAIVPGFTSAKISRREIDPSEAGARTIGHMGFFRKEHATTLWPIVLEAFS